MGDESPDSSTEKRIDRLESVVKQQNETIREMLPGRRAVIAGGAAAALGFGAGAGSASGQSAAGQVGTESEPVDVEAAGVNAGSVKAGQVNNTLFVESGDDVQAIYDSLEIGDKLVITENTQINNPLTFDTNGVTIQYDGKLIPENDDDGIVQTGQTRYITTQGTAKPELLKDENDNQTSSTSHGLVAKHSTQGFVGVNGAGGHGVFLTDDGSGLPLYNDLAVMAQFCGLDGFRVEDTGGSTALNVNDLWVLAQNNGRHGIALEDGQSFRLYAASENNNDRGILIGFPVRSVRLFGYCESNGIEPAVFIDGANEVVYHPSGPQSEAEITDGSNASGLMRGMDVRNGAMRFYDGYTLRKLGEDLTTRNPDTEEIARHDGSGTPSESICFADGAGNWYNIVDGNTF